MVRRGRRYSFLALIAAIAVIGSGWLRQPGATVARADAFDATLHTSALVESLPLTLAPPLDPGVRLVALVASDIDADGDLDLVANDGSLDLLVWINDGAGHLTREHGKRTGHWSSDASTADGDPGGTTVSAIGSSSVHLAPTLLRLTRADHPLSALGDTTPAIRSGSAAARHPRGPPASFPAL